MSEPQPEPDLYREREESPLSRTEQKTARLQRLLGAICVFLFTEYFLQTDHSLLHVANKQDGVTRHSSRDAVLGRTSIFLLGPNNRHCTDRTKIEAAATVTKYDTESILLTEYVLASDMPQRDT
jgi:hypothetical protein